MLDVSIVPTQGLNSLTYRGTNLLGDPFAVKIVPRAHYLDHSIELELQRARRLNNRFARILYYGIGATESPATPVPDLDKCYCIVMEWVEGETLTGFLASQRGRISVSDFRSLGRQFLEALAGLQDEELVHNDLHGNNVMLVSRQAALTGEVKLSLRVIDTGAIKTRARRESLLHELESTIQTLSTQQAREPSDSLDKAIADNRKQLAWWSREDYEWIAKHLTDIYNAALPSQHALGGFERRFLYELPQLLQKMLDPDVSARLYEPRRLWEEIELLWARLSIPKSAAMVGPFDLISAELIRRPETINQLFSDKTPWADKCRTLDPVYIYGPRGCGKSTMLRKLALESVLASVDPVRSFNSIPYIGVYISCSTELRSRFWLFPKNKYEQIRADAVEFFNLLLIEGLVKAFTLIADSGKNNTLNRSIGLTRDCQRELVKIICTAFQLEREPRRLAGTTWLEYAAKELRVKKAAVWRTILNGGSDHIPNSSLVFDVCREIEEVFPLIKRKHIAFLLDDYSNQRIPVELQKILNQTISFARQINPIFKVSSEYLGVDLDGIQHGREVVEVNFGREYVDLADDARTAFLEDIIDIRFSINETHLTATKLLSKSRLSAGLPMARKIRDAAKSGKQRELFHYFGIDTVADICSGDIAMALDVMREMYNRMPSPRTSFPIPPTKQNEVIKEYSDNEHLHLRYARHGRTISRVIDRLCWLAHQCAIQKISIKDRKKEPMIKTHLDIVNRARWQLDETLREVFETMIKRGCLFSLDTSTSRIDGEGTERFQVRRILLVKYGSPLARRDPIKVDTAETLQLLLQDPEEFVRRELAKERNVHPSPKNS